MMTSPRNNKNIKFLETRIETTVRGAGGGKKWRVKAHVYLSFFLFKKKKKTPFL